jgi:para-aminobenzoate synthetase/4-amino-4-deoxychorismate lyase
MGEVDDVILYNERGEITEATIANIAVCLDGTWYTPPVSSGLLAGTMRRHLLETGKLQERALTVNDLKKAPGIKLINSVRGLFEVELID